MSVSHSSKEELYDFMFVMEVGITLMELCYNLTTIALPRPTNDDSIRTCSFFLLYYTKIACQATILQRQLFYISILVPFFYSSL